MKRYLRSHSHKWIENCWFVGGVILCACNPTPSPASTDTASGTGTGGMATEDTEGLPTSGQSTEVDSGTDGASASAGGTTTDSATTTSTSTSDGSTTDDMPPGEGCEPLPTKIELADVAQGIGGFALISEYQIKEQKPWFLGASVSHAGDVNGDGLDDVIIGAPNGSVSVPFDGRAYVVFGKNTTEAVKMQDIVAGVGGFVINSLGDIEEEGMGISVSEAGDVNGDGLADLIIGNRIAEQSAKYVIFGKKDTAPVNPEDIAQGLGGFVILQNDGWSGFAVAGGGDVNGDGLDDVLLSTPYFEETEEGRSFVIFGKKDTAPVYSTELLQGKGGYVIHSQEFEYLGGTLDVVGDVNGDGLDDIAIAAPYDPDINGPYSTRVYVSLGKADTLSVAVSDLAAGKGGFSIEGETVDQQVKAYFTVQVRQAGDMNADGLADIVIGEMYAPGGSEPEGRSYVVLGKKDTNVVQLSDIAQGIGGFAVSGGNPLDYFGSSVGGGGDYNKDGYDDIIVGSFGWKYDEMEPGKYETGRAYIIYGNAKAQGVNFLDLEAGAGGLLIEGAWTHSNAGFSVDVAGDINGDGFSDWIIGAPGPELDDGQDAIVGPEQSYVVFGGCKNTFIER